MGYTFCESWTTANKVVESCVTEYKAVSRYLTHKKVGNCLWMVIKDVKTGKLVIVLYLLSKSGGKWGYKDMSESVFPYYYSCPLEYLDMCGETCAEWRAEVRKWHARQAKIKQLRQATKVGDIVNLRGCKIPNAVVQSLKPFTGSYGGKLYRLNWDIISVEV